MLQMVGGLFQGNNFEKIYKWKNVWGNTHVINSTANISVIS